MMFEKENPLRSAFVVVFIAAVCFLNPPAASAVPVDPSARGSGGSGGNTVECYYPSPLTVVETITDIGGGSYKYGYSFVNVDGSGIWGFGIWTTFEISDPTNFTQCPAWLSLSYPVDMSAPEYDGRNLDPEIIYHADTWTEPMVDAATAIPSRSVVSGFSFTSAHYDPSPKWYNYETIASGWAMMNGTGKLAAVGLTVPEPATFFLLGLGGTALLRRRRPL